MKPTGKSTTVLIKAVFALPLLIFRVAGHALAVLIALELAVSSRPMPGQTISFFRQFTTPGMDQATAVAADASGIYVVGNRRSQTGAGASVGVRKFDSRGNALWTRDFGPPVFGNVESIIATGDETGPYVVAAAAGLAFVRKYDAEGSELWTRQLGFSLMGGMAVDATGVYVAGLDRLPTDPRVPPVGFVQKYSPAGAELWTSRVENQFPRGVAVDATGVYIVGLPAFGGAGQPAGSMRKYDARGNELWARQLDFQPGWAGAAAAHPAGLFVIGDHNLLHRYDADGSELWIRQIGTRLLRVAADAAGVYVVGSLPPAVFGPWNALPGQCRSGSFDDAFVRNYDPNGTELWTREFGTPYSTGSIGVASDASSVYVVGAAGAPGARNWESSAFLAKFEKAPAVVTGSRPRVFPDCVVNAASYVGGGVAPGEIVTLFGSAMGPSELVRFRLAEDRRLATTLADARILFNGVPAPLLYVSDKQSSAIVPYAAAGRTSVDVQVEYKGVRSDVMTVPVLASRPGIFSLDGSGQGQAAILNEDGSLNSPSNPASRGSIITIYATGGGEAAPGVVDGQILSDILPTSILPVSVYFDLYPYSDSDDDPKQGEVLYAGGVSGSVPGLLQVNVRVPANAVVTGDAVPFGLTIGSDGTVFQVTMALR